MPSVTPRKRQNHGAGHRASHPTKRELLDWSVALKPAKAALLFSPLSRHMAKPMP